MRIALAIAVALIGIRAFAADADTRAALNIVLPPEKEIALALSAAPAHLRGQATVYVYGPKGFEVARQGRNGFTCLVNRDGFFYGGTAVKPTCWDPAGADSYVPVMLRVGELLAKGEELPAIRADIAAGFAAGRFHKPKRTGIAFMLAGDVTVDSTGAVTKQQFPGHYMFYAPGVTNADIGYSAAAAKAGANLPSIFAGGAGGADLAYLIVVPHHAPPHEPPHEP
jgi:hypothetical protein